MTNNIIAGLTEGHNYPIRKNPEQIIFDDCFWNNVILVDIDYLINNNEQIIKRVKKLKNI